MNRQEGPIFQVIRDMQITQPWQNDLKTTAANSGASPAERTKKIAQICFENYKKERQI